MANDSHSLYFKPMKTITITGRDKDIYNIVKENRIRAKRHGLEITGDIEKPSIVPTEIQAKSELKELRKEAKKLKIRGFNMMKEEKLKTRIAEAKELKQKEDKGAASRKTKEEKLKLKTK